MKGENWFRLLLILYLTSTAYCLFIGVYETFYSLGIYLLLSIQAIGLVIFVLHLIVTKHCLSRQSKSQKSLKWGIVAVVFFQLLWIISHRIENYQPTYIISIPSDYLGCVYLFDSEENGADTDVTPLGYGYLGNLGKGQWEVLRAGIDISESFAKSESNEISIYSEDSTRLTVYRVICFEVNDSNIYKTRSYNQSFACMEASEFLQLIEENYIDQSKLRKSVWKLSEATGEWQPIIETSAK